MYNFVKCQHQLMGIDSIAMEDVTYDVSILKACLAINQYFCSKPQKCYLVFEWNNISLFEDKCHHKSDMAVDMMSPSILLYTVLSRNTSFQEIV